MAANPGQVPEQPKKPVSRSVIVTAYVAIIYVCLESLVSNVYHDMHAGGNVPAAITFFAGTTAPLMCAVLAHVAAHLNFHWSLKTGIFGAVAALMYVSASAATKTLAPALGLGPALVLSVTADTVSILLLGVLIENSARKTAWKKWEAQQAAAEARKTRAVPENQPVPVIPGQARVPENYAPIRFPEMPAVPQTSLPAGSGTGGSLRNDAGIAPAVPGPLPAAIASPAQAGQESSAGSTVAPPASRPPKPAVSSRPAGPAKPDRPAGSAVGARGRGRPRRDPAELKARVKTAFNEHAGNTGRTPTFNEIKIAIGGGANDAILKALREVKEEAAESAPGEAPEAAG